jgi:hypothetical protein
MTVGMASRPSIFGNHANHWKTIHRTSRLQFLLKLLTRQRIPSLIQFLSFVLIVYWIISNILLLRNLNVLVVDANDLITFSNGERLGWKGLNSSSGVDIVNNSISSCHCVHCCNDNDCGHIWMASVGKDVTYRKQMEDEIHVVISHCMHDLSWVEPFFDGYTIASIHVYSKCGKELTGLPSGATVIPFSNVGRNDHTFAFHIANHTMWHQHIGNTSSAIPSKRRIFCFLKDNRRTAEDRGGKWRSLEELLRITSSFEFACALETNVYRKYTIILKAGLTAFSVSAFHKKKMIHKFSISQYETKAGTYTNFSDPNYQQFKSGFKSLESWLKSIPFAFPTSPLLQVCYGGSFITTDEAIFKYPHTSWMALERSLSRANNIEEGHFMERSWAGLLSRPLRRQEAFAVLNYSTGFAKRFHLRGAFIHQLGPGDVEDSSHTQWEFCSSGVKQ